MQIEGTNQIYRKGFSYKKNPNQVPALYLPISAKQAIQSQTIMPISEYRICQVHS